MAHAELLENCRSYFQRAQSSWDSYFSKWEVMVCDKQVSGGDYNENMCQERFHVNAMEEEEEEEAEAEGGAEDGGDEEGPGQGEGSGSWKNETTAPMKHRNKAIRARNKRRDRMSSIKKLNDGRKRVHSKTLDRKRKGGIIHKTENQTNLECGVVNNKHFEADLKAIFIEILSENTNRMGMFSVLSRMFSRGTISNFSLSSMIMEKNEFSINPVSETIFNSRNGFRSREFYPGIPALSGAGTELGNAALHSGLKAVSHLGFHLTRPGPGPYCLTPGLGRGRSTDDKRTRGNRFSDSIHRDSLLPQERAPDHARMVPDKDSTRTVSQQSNPSLQFNHRSPEAVLREISSRPMSSASEPTGIRKRTRFGLVFGGSKPGDDGSDDEKNGSANPHPGRLLKIYCTPKRPRRSVRSDEDETDKVTHDSDDEFFKIFDTVKKR